MSGISLHTLNQGEKKGICNFKFFLSKETDKESLVIYTFNKELSIKLKNQYGFLRNNFYLIFENIKTSISQLTFLVPNLERDVNAIFEYQKKKI